MKAKVINLLIKGGFNQESVAAMIEAHFDYAVNTYPEAKARFLADVVSAL
jgi:hypothetical protein